jgi:hypothetical protein
MTAPTPPTGTTGSGGRTGPVLRRPPAPSGEVTRLVPRSARPEADEPAPRAVDGALALAVGHRPTPAPAANRHLAPVGSTGNEPERGPTAPHDREVRAWAGRFAQAVVEVAGGDRPLPQLLRWTSPRVYAELGRRVRVMAQTRPVERRRSTVRPQVRSVHLCRPLPTVAEVSVHVRHGRRSRAIAARLELRSGRWTCTALRIG